MRDQLLAASDDGTLEQILKEKATRVVFHSSEVNCVRSFFLSFLVLGQGKSLDGFALLIHVMM